MSHTGLSNPVLDENIANHTGQEKSNKSVTANASNVVAPNFPT